MTATDSTAKPVRNTADKGWYLQLLVKSLLMGLLVFAACFPDTDIPVSVGFLWLAMISPILAYGLLALIFILLVLLPRKFSHGRLLRSGLLLLCGTALFAGLCVLTRQTLRRAAERETDRRIAYYKDNAEAVLVLDPSVWYAGGIRETGMVNPAIFVDYDTHSAAFLPDNRTFKEYHLTDDGVEPRGRVQCEIPLPAPAEKLVSYYSGQQNEVHRTTSLELVMADGTRYVCDVTSQAFDDDALGLDARKDGSYYSPYPDL